MAYIDLENIFNTFFLLLVYFCPITFARAGDMPKSILIFGDSHVYGPMGESLHETLRKTTQAKVFTMGAVGATASSYLDNNPIHRRARLGVRSREDGQESKFVSNKQSYTLPDLKTLNDEKTPDLIVIELGDNFAGYQAKTISLDQVRKETQRMKLALQNLAPHTRCVWISPLGTDHENTAPYFKTNERLAKVVATIKSELGSRCEFIDSMQDLNIDQKEIHTGKDHLHFKTESGKLWGEQAAKKIIELINRSTANKNNNDKASNSSNN